MDTLSMNEHDGATSDQEKMMMKRRGKAVDLIRGL